MNQERCEVRLVEVKDGDTIVVKWCGKVERVRLLLIDTPEMNYSRYGTHPDPFAFEARQYIEHILIFANKIEIELDHALRDHHGRLLAHVFADGKNVNEQLLKKGYARYAYDFGDHKYEAKYRKAERYAKKNKLNIWSQKKPLFRKNRFYSIPRPT